MVNNIKLVVSDFDNTLLPQEKMISYEAIQFLKDLYRQGILFTIISGRPPHTLTKYIRNIPISAPIVGCNGAFIVDQNTCKILSGYPLPLIPLQPLLELSLDQKFTVLIFDGKTEYALSETAWTQVRNDRGIVIPIIDLSKLIDSKNIYKVNIISEGNENAYSRILQLVNELSSSYSIVNYKNLGFEIVANGATKKTGLEFLCELLKLKMKNILAIGDSINDLEMITAAGIGVAVSNATDSLKDIADYICDKGYTEGVMEAIMKFVI